MFGSIWHIARSIYSRRRCGIDAGDIEHLRADLRFRLALVEYAYFGRSGKRVARCLVELKGLLGEKAIHRYLRTLDPDLQTQFVERFQGGSREASARHASPERERKRPAAARPSRHPADNPFSANVVPIKSALRKGGGVDIKPPRGTSPSLSDAAKSVDSGD